MDLGVENTLITRLFADALAKAQAMRLGFTAALDVENALFTEAGAPASKPVKAAFRKLVADIAADGVLTDGERRQLVAFLAQHGLTLQPPVAATLGVDIDGIDL